MISGPFFIGFLVGRWLPDDGLRTPFGHTPADANVCLIALVVERNDLAVDTVLSGSFASAFTTEGYLTLKSLSFRDRRLTSPLRLNAIAR
jgi:hypothetical protein